jgi:hypothetical protein
MDAISTGPTGGSAATEAMLVRAAEADPSTSAKLLKKSMDMDKNLVSTLLPDPGHQVNLLA